LSVTHRNEVAEIATAPAPGTSHGLAVRKAVKDAIFLAGRTVVATALLALTDRILHHLQKTFEMNLAVVQGEAVLYWMTWYMRWYIVLLGFFGIEYCWVEFKLSRRRV
jgi:hypothetical protein